MGTLGFAASVAVVIALYLWGLWVARRQATLVFRIAASGVMVGGGLALAGFVWAMQQAANARELASSSAGDAVRYAQGISGVFAVVALPIGLGNLILLASIVVLAVGTLRRPRS